MSGLDNFLFELQRNNPVIYSLFGDAAYGAGYLQCIRSYYWSIVGIPLTAAQVLVNKRMKSPRETIEWSYGDVKNIFQLSPDPKNYQLGKKNPYFLEQTRVIFLLYNIYVCANENSTSGYANFNCQPPSISECLDLD